jgi:GNAT superfamily N-acetyltransferase
MAEFSDAELFHRGVETLIVSWESYARGVPGAAVVRMPGVSSAVFPDEPERRDYNNAFLESNLGATGRADALDAMESAYVAAKLTRFAAWVHEHDVAMRGDLERRGYIIETSTRAMGMALAHVNPSQPEIESGSLDWCEYSRLFGSSARVFTGMDFRLVTASLAGSVVASAISFDFCGDCGIFNVVTLEHARRRGIGTALVARLLQDARDRGCQTASLQSTPMAERVYVALGFRDLGRIVEYVPSDSARS